MKPILPSLREKNRYIVYALKSDKKLKFDDIKMAIEKAHLDFLGELGSASSGIRVMDHFSQNKGIVKVNSKFLDKSRVALMMMDKVKGSKVEVKNVGVSGTLKKAKAKFFNNGGGV
ncbi:ribonuclease P protein component 2 [Candidatus Woesearchaeota archaeon]|nr:ribonuclease P protein component 2 [Candidatus Woesearchaeota archaeon]